jgi:hypothetical protein
MRNSLFCAAAFAAASGFCAPAWATVIDAIYKGTISSGTDGLGLFGPAGGDLTGDAFVVTFEYDTTKGNWVVQTAMENLIEGGIVYGDSSPMLKAIVEINGVDGPVIDGADNGTIQTFAGYPGINNQVYHGATDTDIVDSVSVYKTASSSVGDIPLTIDVPLTVTFASTDVGGGSAIWHVGGNATQASFNAASLTYAYPSSGTAPEPSTWAMMLVGFAGLGYIGLRKATGMQARW